MVVYKVAKMIDNPWQIKCQKEAIIVHSSLANSINVNQSFQREIINEINLSQLLANK